MNDILSSHTNVLTESHINGEDFITAHRDGGWETGETAGPGLQEVGPRGEQSPELSSV